MAASPHASRRNHFAGYRVSTQTSLRDALLSGTDKYWKRESNPFFVSSSKVVKKIPQLLLQKSVSLSSFFFVFFFVVVLSSSSSSSRRRRPHYLLLSSFSLSLLLQVVWCCCCFVPKIIKVKRKTKGKHTRFGEQKKKKRGGGQKSLCYRVPKYRMYNLGYQNRKRGRVLFPLL